MWRSLDKTGGRDWGIGQDQDNIVYLYEVLQNIFKYIKNKILPLPLSVSIFLQEAQYFYMNYVIDYERKI